MADISTLTLEELVANRFDLVESILAGEHEGSIISSIIADKDGNITQWTEERLDIDAVLISKRVDNYTYYTTGEIDTIIMKWYDKDNKISEIVVEHETKKKIKIEKL